MTETTTPEGRTAVAPTREVTGPVTLINSFVVAEDRDDEFQQMWNATSGYFKTQPGFLSLRLHRAVTPGARYRWVNVVRWASEADYRAAHSTEEFRRLVSQEGWAEFPSTPTIYEVVTAAG